MTHKANVTALDNPGPWGTLTYTNASGDTKTRQARKVARQGATAHVWEMIRSNGDTGHATVRNDSVRSFTV